MDGGRHRARCDPRALRTPQTRVTVDVAEPVSGRSLDPAVRDAVVTQSCSVTCSARSARDAETPRFEARSTWRAAGQYQLPVRVVPPHGWRQRRPSEVPGGSSDHGATVRYGWCSRQGRESIRSMRRRCAGWAPRWCARCGRRPASRCGSWSVATRASPASGSSASWRSASRSQGGTLTSAGIIPTPAIAYLTPRMGFTAGVVISASHNPFEDNGIKVFSGAGEKFTEALEQGGRSDRRRHVVVGGGWRRGRVEQVDYRPDTSRTCRRFCRRRCAHAACASPSTAPTAPRRRWRRGCFGSSASTCACIGMRAGRPQHQPRGADRRTASRWRRTVVERRLRARDRLRRRRRSRDLRRRAARSSTAMR